MRVQSHTSQLCSGRSTQSMQCKSFERSVARPLRMHLLECTCACEHGQARVGAGAYVLCELHSPHDAYAPVSAFACVFLRSGACAHAVRCHRWLRCAHAPALTRCTHPSTHPPCACAWLRELQDDDGEAELLCEWHSVQQLRPMPPPPPRGFTDVRACLAERRLA
eukprot:6177326-Pleurochrysis_carterae.AAC.2